MLTSIQSLNMSNLGLLTAFNEIFSSPDQALAEHRASLRRFPVGELMDRDLDTDWGILGVMPDGEKNWLEG